MDIFDLNISEFIKKFMILTDEEKKNIIKNPSLKNIDPNYILSIFNTSDEEIKSLILNDDIITSMLLKAAMNKSSKLNCLSLDVQKKIVDNPSVFLHFKKDEFLKLLGYMNIDIYKQSINELNKYIYENRIETDNTLLNELKQLYTNYKEYKFSGRYVLTLMANIVKKYDINKDVDEPIFSNIVKNICEGKINYFELYRIDTYEQLYIYDKLGIVVNKKLFLDNDYGISFENINKLKTCNLLWIVNSLKEKNDKLDDTKILVTAVKMYCLFGFDNCKKVLDNKFTYSTNASLKRAAAFKYITDRRKRRINNPNDFLNYELVTKLKNAIIHDDQIAFMKHIIVENKEFKVTEFIELKEKYKLCKNINELSKEITIKLKNDVDNREKITELEYNNEYQNNNNFKREPIKASELFCLFSDFNINLTEFDGNNVKMNDELKIFLLGNTKKDNDCLLRLVLNNQGLDYNLELINIINSYSKIIEKLKPNSTSKYSLLDVLDVYKTIQYQLKTDELQIPLSILTKIALSKKHLRISKEEVINIFKNIYKNCRNKYYSTIPKVKGTTDNGYQYKILDKNDPELATCGIDTGNCFKPGGRGEDFYKYCLTSPYADVIGITDPENNLYIVPIIRNGNGIYGNGIDPEHISDDKLPFIIEALKECYNKIIEQSDSNEKIDFCTLSNLHNYIRNASKYQKFEFENIPIIGKYFYTDILKPELTNYVLCGSPENKKDYIPKHKYMIDRQKPYYYSKEQGKNKSIVEQKINEITYQSIDEMNIEEEKKQELKSKFIKINIDDYIYVIGNDDWYIAVNKDFDFKTGLIPIDPRANEELKKELINVEQTNQDIRNKIR